MHIILVAPAIQDYCVEYANGLAKRARVTMLAPDRYFADYARFVDPSVDLRLLDWPRHASLRNPYFVLRLARLIDKLRPSAVHFLSEGVVWLNLIVPVARKYGIVTTVHDVRYHAGDRGSRRVPRWLVDLLINRSDRIIVHGDALRNTAAEHYPRLAGRIDVLPHVMLRRYCHIASAERMRRRQDSTINLLFFGRISAYKGLDVLIRSVPMVVANFADIRVIIAGEGDDIAPYQKSMANPELFEVRNRRIPDDETAQLFTDADVVVLPYIDGSQSGVLAIANAFAKPVIVTNVGEIGHTVQNEVTGLVIPAANERALADAILRLATDPALRTRLGQAGYDAAHAAASADLIAEKALAIYRMASRQHTT
jgi:glycosyltransferase involved in cell wall biosynthesis